MSLFGIDSAPSKYRDSITINGNNTILFSEKNDDVLSGRSDIFDDWRKITLRVLSAFSAMINDRISCQQIMCL